MPKAGKREPSEPAGEPAPARRFGKVHRLYRVDADGLIAPTDLELAEGRAHKRKCLYPGDTDVEAAWLKAHEELTRKEGLPATTRCARCHTIRYGRSWRAPCGCCGLVPDRDF